MTWSVLISEFLLKVFSFKVTLYIFNNLSPEIFIFQLLLFVMDFVTLVMGNSLQFTKPKIPQAIIVRKSSQFGIFLVLA